MNETKVIVWNETVWSGHTAPRSQNCKEKLRQNQTENCLKFNALASLKIFILAWGNSSGWIIPVVNFIPNKNKPTVPRFQDFT